MKNSKKISKFLSYTLRHDPGGIGLALDANGWANIDELLRRAALAGKPLSREQLAEVVATNDKQRFSISEDGQRIRANQGHSISVDLALSPLAPPETLYHGTASRFIRSIFAQGLQPRNRHHVHLSKDAATALSVGRRHGEPVVLVVRSEAMSADGYTFYCSANGVWLTDEVPPRYLFTRGESCA